MDSRQACTNIMVLKTQSIHVTGFSAQHYFFPCSLQDLYFHYLPWFTASCSLQHDGFSSLGVWAGEDHGLSSLAICHYFVGYKQCHISRAHSTAGGAQSCSYIWLPHEWVCNRLLRSSIFNDCYRDKLEWSSIQEVGCINITVVQEIHHCWENSI